MPSDIPNIANSARQRVFLGLILFAAAALRYTVALRRPLQVDEGYSLHLASLPLPTALRAVATLDVHPPLFLIVLHGLVRIGLADSAIRLLAATLGLISIALLFALVRAWHGEGAALTAAGCAAFMPSLIFYDPMVRMYAPFDVLAVGSFAVLGTLYARESLPAAPRRMLWVMWSLLCAAMIWTLYLGFAVIAVQVAYALLRRRDGLARSLLGGCAACALWLPQFPTFVRQLPAGGLAFPFYQQHQAAALFDLPAQATIAPQTALVGGVAVIAGLVAWLWTGWALALGLPGNGRSPAAWMPLIGALTLVVGVAAHKLLYTDRYYLLFTYGLCALTGVATARALSQRGRAAAMTACAGAAVLAVLGCSYAFDRNLYTADWASIGGLLRSRTQTTDLIVFEQGSPFFVLAREQALDHRPLVVVFRPADVGAALHLSRPFSRVWLVVFQSAPVDPSLSLVRGLEKRYSPVGAWEYPRWLPAEGVSVVLFERPAASRSRVLTPLPRKSGP